MRTCIRMLFDSSETYPESSLRTQGPIRRGGDYQGEMADDLIPTTENGGYRSLRSQGRRGEITPQRNPASH